MTKTITIIGGGIAGIEAARLVAEQGYNVFVVEKKNQIGGNINNWYHLFPNNRDANDIRVYIDRILEQSNITMLKQTDVDKIVKFENKFVVVTDKNLEIKSDVLLVATGFEPFDAELKEEYGYKIYNNVITSVDLEKYFKENKPLLTSQKKVPQRIAYVHCVGSRDAKVGHTYCSKVCCITGVKQSIEVQKRIPNIENYCFYMDLRMFNLQYEKYYKDAQQHHHTQFIRGRVSEVAENRDGSLQIKAEDTLSGMPMRMRVDMLVLLVGMEPSALLKQINNQLGLELEPNGFVQTKDVHLQNNYTNIDGVFVAGTAIGPMTINETFNHSRNAAMEIIKYLSR